MWINFTYILTGLVLLFYGGDFLVTGSTRISRLFKISPFIIGATVLAFGTSAPEFAVSILAAIEGVPAVAMGNVIGSNIANVGLVLGLTPLLVTLTIKKQRLNQEIPALLIATFLIMGLAWNSSLDRWEGGLMVLFLAVYVWNAFRKKEEIEVDLEEGIHFMADKGWTIQVLFIIVGLVFLILGAQLLVDGGVAVAQIFGVSQWFIAITIIAVGTSLPELVATLMAGYRGHGEMAIGNIFGSNIFNILMVLGCTAVVHPLQIMEDIRFDLIYSTSLTCLLLVMIRMKYNLIKWQGFVLLGGYIVYVGLKGTGEF